MLEGFSLAFQVPHLPAGSYNIGTGSQPMPTFEHPYRSLEQSGDFVEAGRPALSSPRVPVPGPAETSKELLRIAS